MGVISLSIIRELAYSALVETKEYNMFHIVHSLQFMWLPGNLYKGKNAKVFVSCNMI